MYNVQENGIQLGIFIQDIQSFICNNVTGPFDDLDEFSTLEANIIQIMFPMNSNSHTKSSGVRTIKKKNLFSRFKSVKS